MSQHSFKTLALETGSSDHCLIYAVLNTKPMRPKNDIITRRSFKSGRLSSCMVPFVVAYTFGDPDDVYWCWEKLYNRIFDDHAPVIVIYFS